MEMEMEMEMEMILGEVQLEWSVVGLVGPRSLRLRHCIRRTPLRPTDDWQVSSLVTLQGLKLVKRRDWESPSWQLLSSADDGDSSDIHSMDWLWLCTRILRKECG